MPIFMRTNCIITASGIVTLCKRLYSMTDGSRMRFCERGLCVRVCVRACMALIRVDSVERIHTSAVVSYAVILRTKCKGI